MKLIYMFENRVREWGRPITVSRKMANIFPISTFIFSLQRKNYARDPMVLLYDYDKWSLTRIILVFNNYSTVIFRLIFICDVERTSLKINSIIFKEKFKTSKIYDDKSN